MIVAVYYKTGDYIALYFISVSLILAYLQYCILSALVASQSVWPNNLLLRMHSKLRTSFSSNATYGINTFKSSGLNSI